MSELPSARSIEGERVVSFTLKDLLDVLRNDVDNDKSDSFDFMGITYTGTRRARMDAFNEIFEELEPEVKDVWDLEAGEDSDSPVVGIDENITVKLKDKIIFIFDKYLEKN